MLPPSGEVRICLGGFDRRFRGAPWSNQVDWVSQTFDLVEPLTRFANERIFGALLRLIVSASRSGYAGAHRGL